MRTRRAWCATARRGPAWAAPGVDSNAETNASATRAPVDRAGRPSQCRGFNPVVSESQSGVTWPKIVFDETRKMPDFMSNAPRISTTPRHPLEERLAAGRVGAPDRASAHEHDRGAAVAVGRDGHERVLVEQHASAGAAGVLGRGRRPEGLQRDRAAASVQVVSVRGSRWLTVAVNPQPSTERARARGSTPWFGRRRARAGPRRTGARTA